MRINEEITSQVKCITDPVLRDFLTWLLSFEKEIFPQRKPIYKVAIEREILKFIENSEEKNKQNAED